MGGASYWNAEGLTTTIQPDDFKQTRGLSD